MTCIIVLGCYRTGTSGVAGVLHHLGVNMGDEFDPPAFSNPKGYYEDVGFKKLHPLIDGSESEFLVACKEYVQQREEHNLWGIKDPKLCLCLSAFLECLTVDSKIIHTTRNTDDICSSLVRAMRGIFEDRQHIKPLVEFYLDAKHRHLIDYTGPVLELGFEELPTSVERIAEFVGLPVTASAEEFLAESG